jgi:hypothetical protein
MSASALAEVARRHGSDFATALLYDRLGRSEPHGSFIRQIVEGGNRPADASVLRVVIVPGAFHKEYAYTGADGARIVQELKARGYRVDVLPLPAFAPLRQNAKFIAQWLARHVASPTVLISISKGGAEVKLALAAEDAAEAFQHVEAWIDLSGILEGTALVEWLRSRKLRWLGLRWWLCHMGYTIETLAELERNENGLLGAPTRLPEHITALHVVGFPLARHLSDRWARRGQRRLAELGPNDGGGILLADAAARPGLVFPVWGADHYLRPAWDIRRLLVRLVHYLEEQRVCPTAIAR